MGIVSYAQNFEDVMLWRALKDVKNGFYIDIGANHPSIDSVTKLFYENGWNGINCEPEKELYKLLEEERPNDINLNIAISSNLQQIEFYVSKVRGWSTTDVLSADNLKEKDSFAECKIVKAMSLDNLCKSYNIKEVHFLKIDVEGAEKDVLESFSFDKIRPWICVIEATKPTTQIDVSIEWEDILIVNKYIFAYFDGLNKYYVAEEHKNFVDILKNPPNVFDEFILANHRDAIIKASEAETKAIQAEEKAAQAETKAIQAEEKAAQAETKTVQAEEKAAQAETKTIQAEEKAAQAETKAIQAEEKSAQAETKAIQAEEKAAQAETKAIQAEEKAAQAETKAIQAEINYHSLLNSNSWKWTKPLRLTGKFVRWFKTGIYHWITFSSTSRPRRVVKKQLITLKHKINANPNLKIKIMKILNYFPPLKNRLKKIGNNHRQEPIDTKQTDIPKHLSPKAKEIYIDLKRSIEKQKGNK